MFKFAAKTLSAIAAAAAIAGVVMIFPGSSETVSASSPLNSGKGDRLDIRAAGAGCSQQAWPYYEADCVKDRRQAMSQARPARVVTADRLK